MRFRNRLLLLVLAILVPAFIGAAVAVAYVYVEQQESQERVMAETGHAFVLLIDNEMRRQKSILRTLAASPARLAGGAATGHTERRVALPDVPVLAKPYDIAQAVRLLGGLAAHE
jgi:small-conductance mechanosensitive channel